MEPLTQICNIFTDIIGAEFRKPVYNIDHNDLDIIYAGRLFLKFRLALTPTILAVYRIIDRIIWQYWHQEQSLNCRSQ